MNQTIDKQIPNRSAFESWKVSGPLPRFLGFLVDSLIVFGALGVWAIFRSRSTDALQFFLLATFIGGAWEGVWVSLTGTTPGKRLFGVSIYSPREDGIPTPLQVCVRILIFWFGASLAGLGLTSILFRRDRRAWHDIISETITIANEKSLPTAQGQRWGQAIFLAQSFIAFSTVGAMMLSAGTGRFSNKKDTLRVACDDKNLLINKTAEVLTALTISPEWTYCLPRLIEALGPLSDSQLARLAELSSTYFEYWTHSQGLGAQMYIQEIQAQEEEICASNRTAESVCKTARSLASVSVGAELDPSSFLVQYKNLSYFLANESDAEKRISALKPLVKEGFDPVIISAIQSRIFAEELALGRAPDISFSSPVYAQWHEKQECWIEALGLDHNENKCEENDLKEAVGIIRSLPTGLSARDARDQLSRLELDSETSLFEKLVSLYEAKQDSTKPELAQKILSEISVVSPARSLASELIK